MRKRGEVPWGSFAVNVFAFAAHLGLMIYASVERSSVNESYSVSREQVAVNPVTGYIETTGIAINFANLPLVDIVISYFAIGAALYLILGVAQLLKSDWAMETYHTGSNQVRWLFTGAIVALMHMPVFYFMGITNEFTHIALFGLIFIAHMILSTSEMVGGSYNSTMYQRVSRVKSSKWMDVLRIGFAVSLALFAYVPIIFAYVNPYIVFADTDKTGMRDHIYAFATLPFIMIVFDVFWTLLLGGRCLKPGVLYELGHVVFLAAPAITVGVLVVYHAT